MGEEIEKEAGLNPDPKLLELKASVDELREGHTSMPKDVVISKISAILAMGRKHGWRLVEHFSYEFLKDGLRAAYNIAQSGLGESAGPDILDTLSR